MTNHSHRIGYHDLKAHSTGPIGKPGSIGQFAMMASFKTNIDVSYLFPYVNSVAENAQLYDKPLLVRFIFEGVYCVLYPERCIASPFADKEHVRLFVDRLIAYLNDINSNFNNITPKHKIFRRVSVPDIIKLLPQTNCQDCGFTTCMAFAATLSQQQTIPGRCPYLGLPLNAQAVYPVYDGTGNLTSKVVIDIDMGRNNVELQHKNEYIDQLVKKVSLLEKNKKDAGEKANNALPSPLTSREIEVLRMVAGGATNKEISELLHISPHTVKSHVINIFNKLGVDDRTQAAVWATQQNII